MAEFASMDGEDDWDDDFAAELIGASLLVGLTHVDHDDRLLYREQVFGTVETADPIQGITLRRHDSGEPFTVAPFLDAIEYAGPGLYQLSESDALVENPEFTMLLTVRAPLRS